MSNGRRSGLGGGYDQAARVVVAALVLMLMLTSGCTSIKQPSDGKEFTAMEKYPFAVNMSKEWKNDSILSYVIGNFKFTKMHIITWSYYFISLSSVQHYDNDTSYEVLRITLYANGSYIRENLRSIHNSTIINWHIDSDIALAIMTSISEINDYIKKEGVSLHSFYLASPSDFNRLNFVGNLDKNNSVWYGEWVCSPEAGSPDTPPGKEIWISANDGHVILS